MLKFKFITVILGLLLSFVTMGADNSIISDGGQTNLTGTTHMARVISPKAIVYSDENMLSPLGYIANGKAILVGNPRKINRELVPLVIYGRLAFIEIKDIRYEDASDEEYNIKRGAPREHNFDILIKNQEDHLTENNSAYLTLHRYTAGDDIKQAFYSIEAVEKDTMSGFNLQFIHRQEISRVFWGAALDYSSVSTTNMKFGYWIIAPTLGYTPIKNRLFLIDVYASLDFSMNMEFEVETNYVNEPSGFLWGPQINARAIFFPESKYHLVAGIGYRKYNVSGITNFKDANDAELPGIQDIGGVALALGVGMEF